MDTPQAPPVYRRAETATFLCLLLSATAGGVLLTHQSLGAPTADLPGVALALVTTLAPLPFLGRMVIELQAQQLRWHWGFLGWPRWQLRLDRIARIERLQRASWLQSGIQFAGRSRVFMPGFGGPALRLHLDDGRFITLGTPEPERLAALIEARLAAKT